MAGNLTRAGTKQNLQEIIEAIRILKQVEIHGREVGSKEREALSKFTGFGAVALKAFPDPSTGLYPDGYEYLGVELRDLLTSEEYASAKATTFTAFFTSPVVMSEMYRGLARMGLAEESRGLEPGCGIGNFIGSAPTPFEFVGVEQDSISGRIAKVLHPEHDIRIGGFEDTDLREGSVDFAIGNVPFAEIKLRHHGERHSLHDFFFLKSLEAVRPGGALALVTSRYTMDKKDSKVRELLSQQADFVAAIRLPGDAFKDQGTQVVTDIIFLRKKLRHRGAEVPEWSDGSWLTASTATLEGGEITLNDYFRQNPHQVLGEMSVGHGMHNSASLRVRSDGELAAALHAAIDGLPEWICPEREEALASAVSLELDPDLPRHVSEGSFYVAPDQTIMQVVGGQGEPVAMREKVLRANGTPGGKRLGALIDLRDRAREVLRTQHDGQAEDFKEAARSRLRAAYTSFTGRYGPINKTTISERQDGGVTRRMPNVLRFRTDPDVYLVMALEHYDERTGTAKPAAIMERDVVSPPAPIESVDSAKDGLVACLNSLGRVDLPTIASLYGRSKGAVLDELSTLIFFDPIEDAYVPADEYLSGNVRQKLRMAEASEDPRTRGNIEALRRVQPEDLVSEEIDVTLGTPWIPARDVKQFLAETLGTSPSVVHVEYVNREALWKVRPLNGSLRATATATSEYGTDDLDAYTLAEQALNMRTPTVRRRIPGGPGESDTYVVDQEATLAAREKQAELKNRFANWAFEDPDRSERLVSHYNTHFNNLKLREFDGSHLTFPRMSSAIEMRPHQKDAIWRNMSGGNTLFAHVVGAGKTFTMVSSGMEMKRTGLAKKPLFVVPNHMLEQFSREYLALYPDANILVASKDDLKKDRRQLLKCRMATGDWDGIVMTHSSFEKIAMSPAFQAGFLESQLEEYEELLASVSDRSLVGNLTKRIEKLKAARKIKVKEMASAGGKDGGLFFDELGIDQVFIDEAHMYKNLETPTKMDRVAGIQTGGSNRAFDLLMKARYLQSKTPGRGLTFATGTPVSNSLGEMYTMMRYLMPDLLAERGIAHFDAWAAAFGEVVNALEISPDGQSLRVNSRFAKFKNLPELLSLFRLSADVQTNAMLDLPIPALTGGKAAIVAAEMTEDQSVVQMALVERYERVRGGGIDPRDDNALKIITDGRKLALDGRMVDPEAEDHPGSKINLLVNRVFEIWQRTAEQQGTQLIFSDLGVSETAWGFSVYGDIIAKLEARGVPREEIADIGDANTDTKKEALFATVRSGRVRILLGSTSKMGTGTNVQEKLYSLHHVDPPWRPADIEQREGRILRQGNTNPEVEIYRYVTEGSFDAYMWQTLETKAKFIAQAMAGDAGTRRADDIGGAELSFAEVKAIATGNPAMLVLAEMDLDVRQLTLLRKAHLRDQAKISAKVKDLPQHIARREHQIADLEEDIAQRQETRGDAFSMTIGEREFTPEKGEKQSARMRAQDALALAVAGAHSIARGTPMPWERKLGELGGLDVVLRADLDRLSKGGEFSLVLEGKAQYRTVRIENPKQCPPMVGQLERRLLGLDKQLAEHRGVHSKMTADLERYQERAGAQFPRETTYQQLIPLRDRLKTLLRRQEAEDGREPPEGIPTEVVPAHEEIRTIIDQYQAMAHKSETPTETEVAEVPEAPAAVVDREPETKPLPEAMAPPAEVAPDVPRAEEAAAEAKLGNDELPTALIVERDRPFLAVKSGEDSWSIQGVGSEHPHRERHQWEPERRGYGWRDDEFVSSHLMADDLVPHLQAHLTEEERQRLIPEQAEILSRAKEAGVQESPFSTGDVAIVMKQEELRPWFGLAVKLPDETWSIQNINDQIPEKDRWFSEAHRTDYGWMEEFWVTSHLAPDDKLPTLAEHLNQDERQRLIPQQAGKLAPKAHAQPAGDQRQEESAVHAGPIRTSAQRRLFDTPALPTARAKPSGRVTRAISARPVQMGLFEMSPASSRGVRRGSSETTDQPVVGQFTAMVEGRSRPTPSATQRTGWEEGR